MHLKTQKSKSDRDECQGFVLQALKTPHRGTKDNKRLIYTKAQYTPRVRVTGWYDTFDSLPIDHDPYSPLNLTQSHYDRLGDETCFCYSTTTNDMLEQHKLKHIFINKYPDKRIFNYFSFKDTSSCTDPDPEINPEMCTMDYNTTMQDSYKPPYPYEMHRLSVRRLPVMATRRCKPVDPKQCKTKFYDEEIIDKVKYLQCHKAFRCNSYNVCTNMYTDGTFPPEKKAACVQLEY